MVKLIVMAFLLWFLVIWLVIVPLSSSLSPNNLLKGSGQQSVEGIGAARSAVDGFIDGEYADGVDDESEGLPESSLLIGCDLLFKW